MKDELLNHKDFIESLKNPLLDIYHKVYHKTRKRRGHPVKNSGEEKMTLAKLATTVNDLAKQMNDCFDRIDARLDYNNLKKLPESK